MRKLIFLSMLSVLIFIGCIDNATGPGEAIELDWIYSTNSYMEELYYTNEDQITVVDTASNGLLWYTISDYYELGITEPNWIEWNLVKCDNINLYRIGSYFTYSNEITPDEVFTRDIVLEWCMWKRK